MYGGVEVWLYYSLPWHLLEVFGSNISKETTYPDQGVRGCPQSIQTN
jgi:hypothetical protein